MKIADHLKKEQRDKPKTSKKKHSPKKKKEECVDWINIMGMNRDRYGRSRGGAMRRK